MKRFYKIFIPFLFMIIFFSINFYLNQNITFFSNNEVTKIFDELINFIYTLFLFSFSFFVINLMNLILFDYFLKNKFNVSIPKFLIQLVDFFVFLIFVIIILNSVYNVSLTGLLAATSALGVGIAFGMRDILSDIFAGIAISIEKPFKLGDNIELDDGVRGKVHDITWRSTSIFSFYETLIIVPNSKINSMILVNYNRPKDFYQVRTEFYLKFSIPIKKIKRILLAVLEKENLKLAPKHVSVHVEDLDTSGIKYSITYFCPDMLVERQLKTRVLSEVIEKLNKVNIRPSYQNIDINYTKLMNQNNSMEKDIFLKKIDLFSILDTIQLENLSNRISEKIINKDEKIIEEGKSDYSLFILVEGLLEVFKKDEKTNIDILVSTLESGEYFGEFSLLTGKLRSATVIAKTEVLVYEINIEDISLILEENSLFEEHLSNVLTKREISNEEKLNKTCIIDTKEKEKIKRSIINRMRSFF